MVMIPNILILDFMTHQLINMVLLAVQIYDFEKMKVILKALIHTDGFNDILVIGLEEDPMVMKTN